VFGRGPLHQHLLRAAAVLRQPAQVPHPEHLRPARQRPLELPRVRLAHRHHHPGVIDHQPDAPEQARAGVRGARGGHAEQPEV
jgi:hypothetical protein